MSVTPPAKNALGPDAIGGDVAVDLLTQVIAGLRPLLDRKTSAKERLITLWSFVIESRALGAIDVLEEAFRDVARDSGLIADLGRHGAEDLEHVLQWGLRGFDPFEKRSPQ
jgi:hypothetical protein